ncbi:MAG: hypothetical protein JJU45_13145 [Acidimicrobiia bacterium]|nr:hypothetical protein [Acidimicrobiia bacterium]
MWGEPTPPTTTGDDTPTRAERGALGRNPRVAAAVVVCASGVLAAVVVRSASAWVPTTDWALIEAEVRAVGRRMPLLGVPSADGFHHPGPLIYYALAPFYRLFGSDPRALSLAAGALAVGTTAAIGATAWRRGGTVLVALTMAVVLWMVGSFPTGTLVDPWNPWVAVVPYLLLVLLAWSVLDGDLWALPAAALVGSFVVQAHVGYLPTVAMLGALCAASLIVRRRRRCDGSSTEDRTASTQPRATPRPPPLRRPVATTAVVLAVCWAGPVVNLAGAEPGNLRRGWQRFGSDTETGRVGLDGASGLMAQVSGWSAPWLGFTEAVDPTTLQVNSSSLWHLSFPVVLLGATWWWSRGDRSLRALALVLTTALLAAIGSAVVLEVGRVFPYVVRFAWVVAAALALGAVWAAAARILGRRPDWTSAITATAVALVVVAAVRLVAVSGDPTVPVYQPDNRAVEAQCLEELLSPVRTEVGSQPVHMETSEFWPVSAAGLFNELDRSASAVEIGERLGFFVHQRAIEPHAGSVQLVVVAGAAIRHWETRSDVTEVARCDLLDPDERAEFERLEALEVRDAFDGGRYLELVPRARATAVFRVDGP